MELKIREINFAAYKLDYLCVLPWHNCEETCFYLEVRAKGGKHDAMAGELLSSTAKSHITEGVVEPQAVEALQDSVGVPGLHKQVVLAAQRSWSSGSSSSNDAAVLRNREGGIQGGRQR